MVDHVPRELATLTLLDAVVEYEAGRSPEGPSTAVRVRVRDVRVDDMMYATRCPVVVAAYDGQGAGVRGDGPLLRGVLISQHVRGRRRLHYPFVSSQLSSTLQVWAGLIDVLTNVLTKTCTAVPSTFCIQLAVNEALVWSLMDMVNRLDMDALDAASPSGGGSSGALVAATSTASALSEQRPAQRRETATADCMVSIGTLDIADIDTLVSFRAGSYDDGFPGLHDDVSWIGWWCFFLDFLCLCVSCRCHFQDVVLSQCTFTSTPRYRLTVPSPTHRPTWPTSLGQWHAGSWPLIGQFHWGTCTSARHGAGKRVHAAVCTAGRGMRTQNAC